MLGVALGIEATRQCSIPCLLLKPPLLLHQDTMISIRIKRRTGICEVVLKIWLTSCQMYAFSCLLRRYWKDTEHSLNLHVLARPVWYVAQLFFLILVWVHSTPAICDVLCGLYVPLLFSQLSLEGLRPSCVGLAFNSTSSCAIDNFALMQARETGAASLVCSQVLQQVGLGVQRWVGAAPSTIISGRWPLLHRVLQVLRTNWSSSKFERRHLEAGQRLSVRVIATICSR